MTIDATKNLEILILRHQLRYCAARLATPGSHTAGPDPARRREPGPAQGPVGLPSGHAADAAALARTLVRWKWTYRKGRKPGRPPINPEIAQLILWLASENSRWGCVRICGEFRTHPLHRLALVP